MRVVAVVWFASVSGCVPLSHEQLIEEDTDGDGIADADQWLELVGAGRQQFLSVGFADLDGDGFDEAFLANRSNSSEFGMPYRGGSVVIVYGRAERPSSPFELVAADAEIIGPTHETGDVMFGVGDFDCDGFDDVAVSVAPVSDPEGGTVHMLYGGRDRFTGRPFIETVGPTLTGVLGFARSAGDLDADGCAELFVWHESGVIVVRGAPERLSSGPVPRDAFFAATADTHFIGAASSGDMDGDGHRDIVVSDELVPGGTMRASMFYGPWSWGVRSIADADAAVTLPNGEWNGVLTGFDSNADGRDELIVSSGWPGDGAVFVVMGDSVRWSGVSLASDLADVTIAGAHIADRIGMSASAGDSDGDGYDDVLLGSPNFQVGGRDVGRAYRFAGPIVAGTSLATAESWQGRLFPVPDGLPRDSMSAERLGSDVAQYGDFDGDGYADALISAPSDYVPLGGRRVRMMFGAARASP